MPRRFGTESVLFLLLVHEPMECARSSRRNSQSPTYKLMYLLQSTEWDRCRNGWLRQANMSPGLRRSFAEATDRFNIGLT